MKMFLISDNVDTYTGMRLAGIEGAVVQTREDLEKNLNRLLNSQEYGIILITEIFGKQYPELINQLKTDHSLPLIVEIPDRHGTGRSKDFITAYVNQAIGLKL